MLKNEQDQSRLRQGWDGIATLGDPVPLRPYGTSWRTQSVHTTLRRVWPLRGLAGVTRVADITELDYLGIPVATAIRPAAHSAQITTCQGKGLRAVDAVVSALLEAIERHSAATFRQLRLASTPELDREGGLHLEPGALGAPSIGSAPIEWVEARSLQDGGPVLVPAAEVLFPYVPPAGVLRPMRPSTSGLASGNTLAEAILHALFEVIERDGVSRYAAGAPAALLDLNAVEGAGERRLLDAFQRAGIEVAVLDLTACAVLPTYRVHLIDLAWREAYLAVSGQGTHVLPALALRRALAEAAQSRLVAIQGSREDLIRHVRNWEADFDELLGAFRLIQAQAAHNGIVGLPAPHTPDVMDTAGALRHVCETLERAGYDQVIYTDLTDPRIGIPVVHVLVPGMVDSVVDAGRRRHAQQP